MFGACRRCGDLDHWADDCPHNQPAATRAEHLARIAGYVRRMHDWQVTPAEKRAMITAENQQWQASQTGASK